MALERRGKLIVAVASALVLGVLVLAWIDGGREPLREIVQPVAVPVPENAR